VLKADILREVKVKKRKNGKEIGMRKKNKKKRGVEKRK
jgi:hypothetical protein